MIEVPLERAHLVYVLANLWPRGAEEFRLLGLSYDEAMLRFEYYAREGLRAHALVADGVPVVVFGAATDENGPFTWFQATNDFDAHALAITRHIRRESAKFEKLSIYSVCVHKDTARWFRALGFTINQQYAVQLPSGAVLRRFDRT